MKTLVQINTTLNSGSTGRIAEQISLLAEKNGWTCYLAHGGRYVNKSKLKTIQVSSKWDNYVHAFLGEFLGIHGFGSYLSTKRFLKKLDEIKPDVVHLHNIHGYYINIQLLFEYLADRNITVVWTLHDCWSVTGHCTHFDYAGCDKWKTECSACPLLMAQYKSRIFDRSRENFKKKKCLYERLTNLTITPVAQWVADLIPFSILKGHKVQKINNGIDLNVFMPVESSIRTKYNIPLDKKILLGVVASGFDKEKGRKEFEELSSDPRYRIILVGLSDEDKKGLPENIICIRRTNSQAELAEFYTGADVFLNPTYNDTFPTTNIEAIACGTPVVTYQTSGSPEIIDNKTGIAVPRGDVKALILAIETCCQNGKAYYSEACVKRAHDLYDKDERFMDYVRLYEELISKK